MSEYFELPGGGKCPHDVLAQFLSALRECADDYREAKRLDRLVSCSFETRNESSHMTLARLTALNEIKYMMATDTERVVGLVEQFFTTCGGVAAPAPASVNL